MGDEQRSRVLVTGGSGFIGRRLVAALLDSGAEVTVADKHEPSVPGVSAVVGDLREPSVADQAVAPGTDAIVHLAAVTSVLRSIEDPVGTYETNVAATAGLLELARTRGVGTFLLASTNAVVGDVGDAVITEQQPTRPLTPYGATKAAGEMLLSCYSASYGIAGCAQLLYHQAAQSSRTAGHQNMLHTLSSRVSLYFPCLSRERLVQKTREHGQM